jgi:pimeloyl-ACP methyl ester carboxylesterase
VPSEGASLHATLYRPHGNGPFPFAIINHGTPGDPQARAAHTTTIFEPAAAWFVRQGYAVLLPQRLGHGATGGPYLEELSSCAFPDYRATSLGAATSIEAAMVAMQAFPFISKRPVLLVGHSAGSMGSFAVASRRPEEVRALINFAGGNGGRYEDEANVNCAPDRLVGVMRDFGAAFRNPTLWLYARNDSYFGPKLSTRMAAAYRAGGGQVEFHLLIPYGDDGHFLMTSPGAMGIWTPIVKDFLARLGR